VLKQLSVQTRRHRELIDVTERVQALIASLGVGEGVCLVYSPHTTAAVTINENADPDVATDLLRAYVDLLGDERRFQHAEGNSGGHALTSLVGPSVLLPVSGGALALGRWQAIYFCEFDGPRQRTLTVQLIASAA
jgi:secondary thiamine-phosphate synthase enzyme